MPGVEQRPPEMVGHLRDDGLIEQMDAALQL